MAKQINRLNARSVVTLMKPGRHSDGGGLYLVVDKSGAKRWTFLFKRGGKLSEAGLGGLNSVPLARARELATECRAMLANGVNPIEARRRSDIVPTFGEWATRYIDSMKPSWRNLKHHSQWTATLKTYASNLTDLPVDTVQTEHVLKALNPIWQKKPETASRVRGRIERILDAARAAGNRSGENPARWRGHLDSLLPARKRLTRGHHPALPYADVPAFLVRLRAVQGVSARALEFTVLTAARSGEVLGATWPELDMKAAVWTVPAERMKGGRLHRVPLSPSAVKLLEEMRQFGAEGFVFPGAKTKRSMVKAVDSNEKTRLSVMSMDMALRRLKIPAVTVHGFRSSFRDWVGEATDFPREVAEAALAHVVGDETERAYRRGDALQKRRKLMETWAQFCDGTAAGNVVAMLIPESKRVA